MSVFQLVFDDPDDECENVLPAPVSEKVVSLDEVVKCAVDEIQVSWWVRYLGDRYYSGNMCEFLGNIWVILQAIELKIQ